MADREALIRAAQPLLEPGEEVANVAKAVEGPDRWRGMGLALAGGFGLALGVGVPLVSLPACWALLQLLYPRRLILATDEGVVLLDCGRAGWRPRRVLARFPIETRIGPLRGLWLQTRLGRHRLVVQPRWAGEVTTADADHPD